MESKRRRRYCPYDDKKKRRMGECQLQHCFVWQVNQSFRMVLYDSWAVQALASEDEHKQKKEENQLDHFLFLQVINMDQCWGKPLVSCCFPTTSAVTNLMMLVDKILLNY